MDRAERWIGFVCLTTAALILVSPASGAGGRYTIDGGTAREQAQVRDALETSSFDWSVLPTPITIEIARGEGSYAVPGKILLDADLLDAGRFSWGVVQHEFAHEVDFLLLDDADRTRFLAVLGGLSWFPSGVLAHGLLTCERFASTLAWAYWPTPDNVMRPTSSEDEAGSVPPAAFRALLANILRAHEIDTVSIEKSGQNLLFPFVADHAYR